MPFAPHPPFPRPPAPRRWRAAATVVGAVAATIALGGGAWWAYAEWDYWRSRSIDRLAEIDDDTAVRSKYDLDGRVQVAVVDGRGTARWGRVFELPDAKRATLVVPFPAAGVGTIGFQVGFRLADGHEIWRHEAPTADCTSFGRTDDLLYARCGEQLIGLEPRTGVERWRARLDHSFRWWRRGDTLVVDGDGDADRAFVLDLHTGATEPLSGHLCVAGDVLVRLEGGELTLQPLDEPTAARTTSVGFVMERPVCGVRGQELILAEATGLDALLVSLDRESGLVRWELDLPLRRGARFPCLLGAYVSLQGDHELPASVPVRVGGEIFLVDLDGGYVRGVEPDAHGTGCAAGTTMENGRAFIVRGSAIERIDAGSSEVESAGLALSLRERPHFGERHVWIHVSDRMGRVRLADLEPDAGSEWLYFAKTTRTFGVP